MDIGSGHKRRELIKKLLLQESRLFSEAKLIDYYKVIFQAFRGPSHFINESSLEFLREEIYLTNINKYPILVDISGFHKMWRVNVNVVSDGIISLDAYAEAHFNTCREKQSDEIRWLEFWEKEQDYFYECLESLHILSSDPKDIGILDFTVACSHSGSYHKYYTPHYRLINYELLPSDVVQVLQDINIRSGN